MDHFLLLIHKPAGFTAFGFVLVQLVTGPRWLKWKLRLKVHRVTGIITVCVAAVHALIGIYFNYFMR